MRILVTTLFTLAAGAAAFSALPAAAEPAFCAVRPNDTHAKLQQCTTLEGARAHQAALQAVADAFGGTRSAGTPGYDASVAYVAETLGAAGYAVELQGFPFLYFGPSTLAQIAPLSATYATGAYIGSGYGTVTANVYPVDLSLLPPRTSTSGCEAGDFAGFPVGSIALIQRGTCSFAIKALNAEAAGASGVIIFNQGNDETRLGLIVGTLAPDSTTIPVVGASFAAGEALALPGSIASITVPAPELITQYNVIAELKGRNADNVVMVGAHLDSVEVGPGIQDNGSGSAAILEVARQMAKVKPRNTVRFAWWATEEAGLVGSTAYVASLSEAELSRIALYLNFDMIGSPNSVYFIYDGDDSDGEGAGPGPSGSDHIESVFEAYYAAKGLPFKGTDFSGRSDYGPFIAVGIPAGGLFTGAEGIKTDEEASIWGGTAGVSYDPCYHLACDTYDNINETTYDVNVDAVAYATLQYAMNTSAINGVRGKGSFKEKKKEGAALAATFQNWGPQPKF